MEVTDKQVCVVGSGSRSSAAFQSSTVRVVVEAADGRG